MPSSNQLQSPHYLRLPLLSSSMANNWGHFLVLLALYLLARCALLRLLSDPIACVLIFFAAYKYKYYSDPVPLRKVQRLLGYPGQLALQRYGAGTDAVRDFADGARYVLSVQHQQQPTQLFLEYRQPLLLEYRQQLLLPWHDRGTDAVREPADIPDAELQLLLEYSEPLLLTWYDRGIDAIRGPIGTVTGYLEPLTELARTHSTLLIAFSTSYEPTSVAFFAGTLHHGKPPRVSPHLLLLPIAPQKSIYCRLDAFSNPHFDLFCELRLRPISPQSERRINSRLIELPATAPQPRRSTLNIFALALPLPKKAALGVIPLAGIPRNIEIETDIYCGIEGGDILNRETWHLFTTAFHLQRYRDALAACEQRTQDGELGALDEYLDDKFLRTMFKRASAELGFFGEEVFYQAQMGFLVEAKRLPAEREMKHLVRLADRETKTHILEFIGDMRLNNYRAELDVRYLKAFDHVDEAYPRYDADPDEEDFDELLASGLKPRRTGPHVLHGWWNDVSLNIDVDPRRHAGMRVEDIQRVEEWLVSVPENRVVEAFRNHGVTVTLEFAVRFLEGWLARLARHDLLITAHGEQLQGFDLFLQPAAVLVSVPIWFGLVVVKPRQSTKLFLMIMALETCEYCEMADVGPWEPGKFQYHSSSDSHSNNANLYPEDPVSRGESLSSGSSELDEITNATTPPSAVEQAPKGIQLRSRSILVGTQGGCGIARKGEPSGINTPPPMKRHEDFQIKLDLAVIFPKLYQPVVEEPLIIVTPQDDLELRQPLPLRRDYALASARASLPQNHLPLTNDVSTEWRNLRADAKQLTTAELLAAEKRLVRDLRIPVWELPRLQRNFNLKAYLARMEKKEAIMRRRVERGLRPTGPPIPI